MPKTAAGWVFSGILIFASLSALEQNPGLVAALIHNATNVFMREVIYPIAPYVMVGFLCYIAFLYWRSRQ